MSNMLNENFVSIIIPCRNEVKHIMQAIDSALNLDYPNELMEILILDGMSDDGTRELLSRLTYPNVRVIDNLNRTTPYAFNLGVKESKGEYVLIHASRVILSRNYLQECIKVLKEKPDVYCVGNGNCENVYDNEEAKIIAIATDSAMALGFGNPRKIDKSRYAENCDTPLYRRSTFEIAGFFDETLTRNQDDEFNYRVKKAGLKTFVTDMISVKYFVRSSFEKLFKQYNQYGYWKVLVNKKLKTITTYRQLVPPFYLLFVFLGGFISYGLNLFFLWISLIFFYIMLTFIEGLRLGKNISTAFKIQYAFFNFHFGYGLGYLKGIWHFLLLNKQPVDEMKKLTR